MARTLANWLPDDAELVVASSMPVRDLEWFGGARARAHANRGANGIDGVVSTALGRALTGRTTVVWVGDIAFVHDSNALVALTERDVDLRIVVADNDGGGIFSFLPQAAELPPPGSSSCSVPPTEPISRHSPAPITFPRSPSPAPPSCARPLTVAGRR